MLKLSRYYSIEKHKKLFKLSETFKQWIVREYSFSDRELTEQKLLADVREKYWQFWYISK